MSAGDVFLTFVVVAILGAIVVAANYAVKNARLRQAVAIVLALVNGLIVLLYGVMQVGAAYSSSSSTAPAKSEAWGALIGAIILGGLATAVLFYPVRKKLAVLFAPLRKVKQTESVRTGVDLNPMADLRAKPDETPLFPQMLNYYTADSIVVPRTATGVLVSTQDTEAQAWVETETRGFNPHSTVHMVALVFCLYMLGIQFINFILEGGLAGVAESFEGKLTGWDLLLNGLPLLIIPVLGIGFGMRRDLRQSLARLGLGMPSLEGIGVSVGLTIALFVFVAGVSMVWMGVVSEETYEEQTQASDALSNSVTTLGLAFLLAITAAVTEEIAFRGALQPVFGFWPTAVIFALTHAQYTLTPAALIILGVAVGFGWIRERYNTTVAILTHFLYNFIPLAIVVAGSEESTSWIFRLF